MNPILPNGSFGPDEFIELDHPELEDADLQTYIAHASKLLERPGPGSPEDLKLYQERLELVIDYLFAELNRRLNPAVIS